MTGRELIIYVLQNDLEDKPVFENGQFLGFLSVEQAAVKLDVGNATVKTWADLGWIPSFEFNGELYFPANIETPELNRE